MERGSPLIICVGDDAGIPAAIMQISDCHWFLPNESPTNITLFPLILARNSAPLNLKSEKHQRKRLIDCRRWWNSECEQRNEPGELAIEGLPSIFEVVGVGAAIHLAVEFGVDDGAGVLVERIGVVAEPGAGEEVAGAAVGLEHGAPVVLIVAAVVAHHQHH